MKLKCIDHRRRVVVFENGRTIHRTGDGSPCEGRGDFRLGERTLSLLEIIEPKEIVISAQGDPLLVN